jgi:hypothetical protein
MHHVHKFALRFYKILNMILFDDTVTSWPGLNRIDRILISTRYTFFSGSSSEKNSRLSVLGLKRFEDG